MKLIPLDALVAEIKRRIKTNKECMLGLRNLDYYQGKVDALNDTISFLDILEVKEVDLEKELIKWHKEHFKKDGTFIGMSGFYLTNNSQIDIAKHFFELGLNASNPLTWEDMMIIHKCIKDAMNYKLYKMMEGLEGQKEVYEEVLKRFKDFKERKR